MAKPIKILPNQTFLLNNKPYHYILNEKDEVVLKKGDGKAKSVKYPTEQEVIDYWASKGYNEIGAKKAYNHYAAGDWTDTNGKPVINWKQKMITNWMRDEYLIKEPSSSSSKFVM